MSAPTVTVVVPTYNGAAFIEASLASVIAQTWLDFELIVVDDGSTDSTRDIVGRCDDPRLRVIARPHSGAGAALNTGLSQARGSLVAILDHDDLWAPLKLERHVAFMQARPHVDLTFSWSRLISAAGRRLSLHSRHHSRRIDFGGLLADFVIGPTSSVVLRRSVLAETGLSDPELTRYYDMDLFLRIALVRPDNVAALPEELTFYRRHRGQLSSDWRGMKGDWARLLERARALAPDQMLAVEEHADANMHRYFAYLAYEQSEYRAALGLLRTAFGRPGGQRFIDARTLTLGAACLAGVLLPGGVYRRLERLTGLRDDDERSIATASRTRSSPSP